MLTSMTSIPGQNSAGKIEGGDTGGVGGFLKAFEAAMADGKISDSEGKDLMDMMKEMLAQATGNKDGAKDKANGVQEKQTGADIGLQQDILKMLMGALDDGKKADEKTKAA